MMLTSVRLDFFFALRQLRKSPGFAFAAVFTLALGIGATTAIYSLIDGVLLRPLPLPHPEKLLAIHTLEQSPGQSPGWSDTSYPDYLDWRAKNRAFAGLAAVDASARLVSKPNGQNGEVIAVNRVSFNYFDVLGVLPMIGRTFAPDEDQAGRHVAVVSYGFWQRVFAKDPQALGSSILISDVPYTIIGVMPAGFVEPRAESADVWASFALPLEGSAPIAKNRRLGIVEIVGRLKDGVGPEQGRADLAAIQAGLAQTYPEERLRNSVVLQSKLEDVSGEMRPALLMLMSAVSGVLLIVCANITGLMLSRGMKRRGEIALRTALGASRWRVLRQLLIESLLLGIFGAAAGIGVAYGLLHIALPLIPEDVPRIGEVGIDFRVLAFAIGVSLFCAMLSGLFPAWKLSKTAPVDALRESSINITSGRRNHRFQNTLVIAQTALGVSLLIASGLLIQGFVNVRRTDLGFNTGHLFEFLLPLTPVHYPDAKKVLFFNELLPKLATLPGVRNVSAGSPLPLRGDYPNASIEIDGRPNPLDRLLTTTVGIAEPDLFATLGIPLLQGRTFTPADNDVNSPFVAVVNQTFVKRYFPNENPIGRHIRPDLRELRNQASDLDPTANQEREIVGVVADTIQQSMTDPPQPYAVFPYAQASMLMRPRVVMRVAGDPMQYEKSVQAVVAGIDPFLFLQAPASMEEQIGLATGSQRFETTLVGSFAAIALFLVGLGLYATLATMVATRTREIGLRLAIGAGRRNIAALILARGASLVLFGLLAGSMIALAASRLMISSTWLHPLLYRVTWFEPQVYFAILLSLGGVAMGACLLPTWRAVRVDPMRVLRDE